MDRLAASVLLIGIVILAACENIGSECEDSAKCSYCDEDTRVLGSCVQEECETISSEDCKILLSNPDAKCVLAEDHPVCLAPTGGTLQVPTDED